MYLQPLTSIVGARRPRALAHLVFAALAAVLALHSPAAQASSEPAPTRHCTEVASVLAEASSGLLMPSESDFPFTPFVWTGAAKRRLTTTRLLEFTGHEPGTPVEVVGLDHFFRNVASHQPWHDREQARDVRRFQRLVTVLERNLTGIRVYRVGTIRIDAFVVGRCGNDLVGLSTTLIET